MSKSGHVTQHDSKEIFRLVGECRELGADPFLWRTHFLERLDRLLGDFVAVAAAGHRALSGTVEPTLVLDRGWDSDGSRKRWLEYMERMGPNVDPNMNAFLERFEPPHRTAVRRQIMSDRDHYESVYYSDYLSPLGIDDSLCSFHEWPDKRFDMVVLHRRGSDRPWSARDRNVLDLVHQEVAPMIGRELASAAGHPAPLAPRLQETLDAMLEGLSEKETAARLELSDHTVHQYVKALYRRYRVHSRTELLALWILRHRLPARSQHLRSPPARSPDAE